MNKKTNFLKTSIQKIRFLFGRETDYRSTILHNKITIGTKKIEDFNDELQVDQKVNSNAKNVVLLKQKDVEGSANITQKEVQQDPVDNNDVSDQRPYLMHVISTLEALFHDNQDNVVVLRNIKDELTCRKTKRAGLLKEEVQKHIDGTIDISSEVSKVTEAEVLEKKRFVNEKSCTFNSTVNRDISEKSDVEIDDSHVSLNDAVRKSDWPITLSQLEVLMSLPGNVIIRKINQSKNYNVRLLHSDKIITPKKISKRNRIMYVLRRRRGAMKLLEIVNDYVDLFKADIAKHYVSNTLALMKDALIVDKGTYNLYENISINNDEIESVRNKTETFLLEKQKYTSSKIILRYLKEVYNNEYLRILNGHFLLGILQDDDRFDCQRGLMIGLTSSKFDAINTDQTTEIIKLMNHQGKPLKTEYIVNSMSSYRQVSKDNIKNLLEAKNELFYCSAPGEFYLIDKKNDIKSTKESENTISNTLRKQRKKKRLLKMASMLSNEKKE